MGYQYSPKQRNTVESLGAVVADISRSIDEKPVNAMNTYAENLHYRTGLKIGSDLGRLTSALAGMTHGGNASAMDVESILLDIAFDALSGIEHMHDNNGTSVQRFADHMVRAVNQMTIDQQEAEKRRAEFDRLIKANNAAVAANARVPLADLLGQPTVSPEARISQQLNAAFHANDHRQGDDG